MRSPPSTPSAGGTSGTSDFSTFRKTFRPFSGLPARDSDASASRFVVGRRGDPAKTQRELARPLHAVQPDEDPVDALRQRWP